MKGLLQTTAWAAGIVVIVLAALSPDGGVMYHSPMAAASMGLIGLGLIKRARERAGLVATDAEPQRGR